MARRTILAVDDDEEVLKMVREYLLADLGRRISRVLAAAEQETF